MSRRFIGMYFKMMLSGCMFMIFSAWTPAAEVTLPGTGTQSATTSPAISGGITGTDSVVKNSEGTFYLDKTNNTYSGGTSITAGTIKITNDGSIGTGTIQIGTSGTLNLDGIMTFTRNVTGSGTISHTGEQKSYPWITGNLSGFTGTFALNGTSIILQSASSMAGILFTNPNEFCAANDTNVGMITGTSGSIRPSMQVGAGKTAAVIVGRDNASETGTYGGTISDFKSGASTYYQAITKIGTNKWILTNANLSYSGATTVQGGVLELAAAAKLTASAVNITSGEFINNGTVVKPVTLRGGTFTNRGTAGSVSAAGNAVLVNSGTTGTLSVGAVKLALTNSGNMGAVTVASGGTLEITARNGLGVWNFVPEITLNGGTLNSAGTSYSNVGKLTLNGGTLSSSGTGEDVKAYGNYPMYGPVLVTANSSITAEKIMIRGQKSAGEGQWTVNPGVTLTVSSIVRMKDSNGSVTPWEKLGGGTLSLNKGANQLVEGGTLKISAGTVRITNGETLGNTALVMNGGTLELANSATAASGITFSKTVTGTGTVSHTGFSASYPIITGDLSGFTGTFALNNTSFIAKSPNSMAGILFTDPNEFCSAVNTSVGMLTGGKPFTTGSGNVTPRIRPSTQIGAEKTVTLTVGRDNAAEVGMFYGDITNYSANSENYYQAITKTGANTWILTSANLAYSGATKVNGGGLELASAARLSQSSVTVADGAVLRNAGTIVKPVTVQDGGVFEAVSGGSVTGGLILNTGATLRGNYAGNAAISRDAVLEFNLDALEEMILNYDAFQDEAIIAVIADDAEALVNQSFRLIQTEADILNQLKFDFTRAPGNVLWSSSYADGFIQLMAADKNSVPEPASWLLLILGVSFMFFRGALHAPVRVSPCDSLK